MAAKSKAALSDSPLCPEQQLQPAPPSALPPSSPDASCQTNPNKVPKQDVHQAEPDPAQPDSEDPAAPVKELDKQEVELLVSLISGWFVVTRFLCMNNPDLIFWLIKARHYLWSFLNS